MYMKKRANSFLTFLEAGMDVAVESRVRRNVNVGTAGREELTKLAVIDDVDRAIALGDPLD
jgi:hypothetical protein